MSIAPARRVSTSSPATRVDRNYSPANRDEQFVEVIDTNNNVSVRDVANARNSARKIFLTKKKPRESKVSIRPCKLRKQYDRGSGSQRCLRRNRRFRQFA